MKFELKVKVLELSEDNIVTIMSGASYGISYWCSEMALEEGMYNKYRKEDDCVEDVQARAIKDGNPMIFRDSEDYDEKYYLTYDRLLKGVEKFIESGRCVDINEIFEEGNEDSEDMDYIIQYALFNDIIFG